MTKNAIKVVAVAAPTPVSQPPPQPPTGPESSSAAPVAGDAPVKDEQVVVHHHAPEEKKEEKHQKRNTWTEARNAFLVATVKERRWASTPWRPKHGTNKEVWEDIVGKMNENPEMFPKPLQWEAAKEQLNKVIDKRRIRKSQNFPPESEMEVTVDAMIDHMLAEDAQKEEEARKQKEKQDRKKAKRNGGLPLPFDSAEGDDASNKKTRISELPIFPGLHSLAASSSSSSSAAASAVALPSSSSSSSSSSSKVAATAAAAAAAVVASAGPAHTLPPGDLEKFYLDREKMRLEAELEKERMRIERDRERDEIQRKRDEQFMKLVQDQMSASQSMLQATQAMMLQIVSKLDGEDGSRPGKK